MALLTEIIQTFGERTEEFVNSRGSISLYPINTKRLVKKTFILPKKINNKRVIGRWIVEQIADIDWIKESEKERYYYNVWRDLNIVEKYSTKITLNGYLNYYLNNFNKHDNT